MTVIMKCGHAANAINIKTGEPSCAICAGLCAGADIIDDNAPSLKGRVAQCSSCGKEKPSNFDLPFFKYRGPGSYDATEMCRCGYNKIAHTNKPKWNNPHRKCNEFRPNPEGKATDEYYCGCRGWD